MTNLKHSGTDWLGEVPSHWELVPAWSLYRRVKRTGHASEELLSVYRDHGVIPKSSRDDNHNVESEDLSGYQLVKPGDLVMNKMKAWQGSIALSEHQGIVSPAYFVFQPLHAGHLKFFHYLLRSQRYVGAYNRISKGVRVGQWDLDPSYFRTLPIPVPPLEEQRAIANFLDAELAQIDQLIEKQKRLIDVSRERRQASISYLVANGIPGAPKQAWRSCRLKDVASIFSSNVDKKSYENGVRVRLCNYVDVYYNDRIDDDLNFMEATASPQEIRRFELKGGWVIATKDSESADDIGISAYVEKDLPGVVCGYHLAIIEPSVHLDGLFLKYFLDSSNTKVELAKRATGLTRVGLGKNDFGSLPISLPPFEAQESIAKRALEECHRFDLLALQAEELIVKLRERRLALVNTAVTGKIDVRAKN